MLILELFKVSNDIYKYKIDCYIIINMNHWNTQYMSSIYMSHSNTDVHYRCLYVWYAGTENH